MVYNGYWFAPEREALQALIDQTQKTVNGVARVKLYKGHCRVVGRKSDTDSLFDPESPPSRRIRFTTRPMPKASSASTPCACVFAAK
jgi:argininosuccinate synthase